MPLPLIPLLIGGGSLIISAYGGKKVYDAKQDFDSAKVFNDNARKTFDTAADSLDNRRRKTNYFLIALGRTKLELNQGALLPFVEYFSRIKNVEFSEKELSVLMIPGSEAEFIALEKSTLEISSIATGSATALGGGVLAGLGALGGVGTLGTASTGTPIAALAGVAAKNATLAWFGGGSLASGGLGMAGGTAILGAIFIAPVLAIGGLLLANKAEEVKAEAYASFEKAKAAAQAMRTAELIVKAIFDRAESLYDIILLVKTALLEAIAQLKLTVEKETDYRQYSEVEKKEVCRGFALAKTASNLINVPIIDENGELTELSKWAYDATRRFLEELGKAGGQTTGQSTETKRSAEERPETAKVAAPILQYWNL